MNGTKTVEDWQTALTSASDKLREAIIKQYYLGVTEVTPIFMTLFVYFQDDKDCLLYTSFQYAT